MPSMDALRDVLTAMSSKDHKVLGGSIATLTALFVVWKCLAKEEPHVTRLHSDLKTVADKEYDVIIIGGGTLKNFQSIIRTNSLYEKVPQAV